MLLLVYSSIISSVISVGIHDNIIMLFVISAIIIIILKIVLVLVVLLIILVVLVYECVINIIGISLSYIIINIISSICDLSILCF